MKKKNEKPILVSNAEALALAKYESIDDAREIQKLYYQLFDARMEDEMTGCGKFEWLAEWLAIKDLFNVAYISGVRAERARKAGRQA